MPLARQSMTHDVAQALNGIGFPADKDKICEYARQHGANKEINDALKALPEEQYTSMADVFKGIGMSEGGRS